jgi:eukaryotic-like serine/threonine-protein kinase
MKREKVDGVYLYEKNFMHAQILKREKLSGNRASYCLQMKILLCLAAFIFLSTTINKGFSQPVMFGTNPQHTGVYSSSMPTDLLLVKKWKFKTNGKILSSAVVKGGIIYFGSDDSCLYALDTTGLLQWKFKSNGFIRSTPAVSDSIVFFNTYGGTLFAINSKTGLEVWHFNTEGEKHFSKKGLFGWTPSDSLMADPWDFYVSSPCISDTAIYFGSGVNVYALNMKDGQLIWKFIAEDVVHSTPAVSNGSVYFGCWSGKFYSINVPDGSVKWTFSTGTDPSHLMQGIQSSPSIIDTVVIIGARDANVYALNTNNGKKIWSTSFGGSWMPSSFAFYNGIVYTGSSEGGGLKALNLKDGKLKFTVATNFYFTFSSPAYANGTIFIGCLNGSLFAVDANTGAIKCRFDTDGRILNPINAILKNGSLNPVVFNPVSGYPYEQAVEYVQRVQTAGSIASTPTIYNSTIFFGSTDSIFYAISDNGLCKPKISVSEKTIAIGTISNYYVSYDTSFYVSNYSDCDDSVAISSTSPYLKDALTITPTNCIIAPGDSQKIKLQFNLSKLKATNYSTKILSQSKSNEYDLFTTLISFTMDIIDHVTRNVKEITSTVYPNPFNENTSIHYKLEKKCFVDIIIINSLGQQVKAITSGIQTAGEYKAIWNGRNDHGAELCSGLYLCTIKRDDSVETRKILLQKAPK